MDTQSAPLFSNDLIGFVKAFSMITAPIFAVAILYLRLNTTSRIREVKNEAERTSTLLKAEVDRKGDALKAEVEAKSAKFTADLNGLGERVTAMTGETQRIRGDVDALRGEIAGSHRDILEAIRASSEAQLKAVHASDIATMNQVNGVRIDIARLQEQTNLGEAMLTFTEAITKLADQVADKHP